MENLYQLLDTCVPNTSALRDMLQGVSECLQSIPIEPRIYVLIGPPSDTKMAVQRALAAVLTASKRSDGSVFLPPDPSDPIGPIGPAENANNYTIRALFIDSPGSLRWHAPTVWSTIRYHEPFNISPRLCCILRGHVFVCANDLTWLPTDHYNISQAVRYVYIEPAGRHMPTRLTIPPAGQTDQTDQTPLRAPRAEDARRHQGFH
jgi:hypothetical protein